LIGLVAVPLFVKLMPAPLVAGVVML